MRFEPARELEFWPAFKNSRPLDSWVILIFEFAGVDSRIVIEPKS